MEYFFNVNTGRVEQRPTNEQFYPGTTVPIAVPFSSSTNQQNLFTPTEPYVSPTYIQKQQLGMVPSGITASSAAVPFGSPIDIQQGFVQGSPSDASFPGTNFEFLPSANEANEADETDEVKERKGGIEELFKFLANFIPGVGLIKRLNESGGIRSLNQRIQQSDFGRSKNLMDYLDIKSYGGYDEREDARAATMTQARGIQKKIDAGDYGTPSNQDRARGQIPSRTTSAPKKSSSNAYSEAKRSFFRD